MMDRRWDRKVRLLLQDPENGLGCFSSPLMVTPLTYPYLQPPRSHILSDIICHQPETLILKLKHKPWSSEMDSIRAVNEGCKEMMGAWIQSGRVQFEDQGWALRVRHE